MLVLKNRVATSSASHAAQALFLREDALCARRLPHSLKGGHHAVQDLVAWLAARCHYPVSHEAAGAPDYLHSAQAPKFSTGAEPLDHGVLERTMRALRGGLGRPLLIAVLLLAVLSWPVWQMLLAAMAGAPDMPEPVAVEMVVLPPAPEPPAEAPTTPSQPPPMQAQPELPPPPVPEEVPPPETAVVEPAPPEPPPVEELAPRPPEEAVQTFEPVAAPEPEPLPEPEPEPQPEPVMAKPEPPPPPPVVPVRRPPPVQAQKPSPPKAVQSPPAPPVQAVTAPPAQVSAPAPAASAAPPAPSLQVAAASARAADAKARYLGQLLAWLGKYKQYPARAKMRNIEGEVSLRLVIARDGKVISAVISNSSGSDILDAGAMNMIERAGRAPAIPDEMDVSDFDVIVPVPFRLN
jgi:protein TonB